jgi:hypothetical protein
MAKFDGNFLAIKLPQLSLRSEFLLLQNGRFAHAINSAIVQA